MKATTTAKIGLGVIGVGIIGYGLYSMKKDTEKLFNAPGNFIDGLFGSDSVLGGSGLPDAEVIREAGSTAKSSFIDGLVDGLSISLGLGLPPSAASPNLEKSGNLPMGTNVAEIKTHQQAVSLGLGLAPLAVNTQSDFKKSSDIYFPMLEAGPGTKYTDTILDVKKSLDLNIPMAGASPVTKYTEKTSSSSSSSNGYTDSTGRVYTPTNVIKAKW
jgi:hypothetical protein